MLLLGAVGIAGALVAVALVLTLGAANRARDAALDRQSRSYEVMILTRSLGGNLAAAEAALGRFVISGDKALGRRFQAEWRRAQGEIDRLRRAVRNSPAQVTRIAALERAYAARGAELGRIALHSNYEQNNQALSAYYDARESAALARIARILARIDAAERGELARRSGEAAATIDASNRAAALLGGFGLLLVAAALALGWAMVGALTARRLADDAAAHERERAAALEAAVVAATERLEAEAAERAAAEATLRQVQKMEAVGQLTGGIAHDFNNMLAVVLGGLDLARRQLAQGGDPLRHIEMASEGAERAAALTRQLLAFARAEPLLPEAIDPAVLIAGMSDLIDRTLGDSIVVVVESDSAGCCIWGDRHQLENAILNLAVNARDAMEGRGTITLATGIATLAEGELGTAAAGDYATIAVRDTGCGMTPEVIERAFEPFFTTKPVGKGTGLGLSQIFGLVRQLSGEIAIRSTPGEGTTVTLYLPRHAGQAVDAAAPVPCPAPAAVAEAGYDVLLVEDDPRVLAATMAALRELGHRPVACGDPLEAERLLREMTATPDIVVTDVLMPGRTGPELIEALAPMLPDAAVLYITGYAGDVGDRALAGAHVLRKPFTLVALAEAVEAAVEQTRAPLPARRRA
ncbi:response regulator [Sphingomonas baiyangensis]|uniref:histidine kinase n=2 Tax=Sphingomonas baiyangensis TaxID=2572576 RepID=A0A4U1L7N7_9SPHN|nr:response regulator [Sphingomonas baiyangensis]